MEQHRILTPEDRYYIDEPKYNNCTLCAINEKGAMTQEEVGKYLNLTKMRISQIERQAIQKLSRRKDGIFFDKHFTICD